MSLILVGKIQIVKVIFFSPYSNVFITTTVVIIIMIIKFFFITAGQKQCDFPGK